MGLCIVLTCTQSLLIHRPILLAPCCAAQTWNDAWTVVTADGKLAAQYEHTILITKEGHEVLTVA